MLKKIIITFLIIIFSIAGYVLVKAYPDFKASNSYIKNDKPVKVTLEFWGLWDNSDDWEEVIKKFENKTYNFNGQKINVSINYTKKDFSSYQEDLQKAKERNSSPDIFMINNNWLEKYVDELEPMEGNEAYAKEYDLLDYADLLDIFYPKTLMDVVYEDQLYGLPLFSDSLSLFYNKDLFEKAGIAEPPKSWTEFKDCVKKLTALNNKDEIIQSGAALGTGKNVNRSSDILSLLIMQGGGGVIDGNGATDINKETEVNTLDGIEKRFPGKRAIEFYMEFSNPKKEIYSWNLNQENSVTAFANNKAAMMIGYGYNINNLLAANPDLNYGIAPMPQLENSTPVNFSNVTIPVVSKFGNCKVEPIELSNKIDCAKISWSFLSFAVEKENSKLYLDSTEKIAARKDLVGGQIEAGEKRRAFASQVESSQSYNKFDDEIDNILVDMLDQINSDRESWEERVDETAIKIDGLKNIKEKL